MDTCDVLIVGGGPGGSSCAWALRRSGLRVAIIDRKRFPRDKICAGWITPQVVEALAIDLEDLSRGRVCQPITSFRTGLIGGREVSTRYEEPVSYGIRRCEFDAYLLERSEAERIEGQGVSQIERQADGWLVNGQIRARLLVGAGGHFCPVARMLGARQQPAAPVVAAQEVEFEVSDADLARGSVEATAPELFFCQDLNGYGWCFRKANFLNIGLGRTDHAQLSTHVRRFVDFLRERGKIACDVPGAMHGHAYQLYDRAPPRLCDDGVLLVGDAAGLAYPQSGEGIRPAVESGLLAAQTILAAAGDYRRPRLEEYAQAVLDRFGQLRKTALADWLPAAWLRAIAGRLLSSERFSRAVVLERWFLHRDEPALRLPVGPGVLATPRQMRADGALSQR